uniref:Uncharacterized protein n=1 Tax=Eutreptiella gymnastica TaxID=73025 RepID=A0A7S4CT94_9EUGL
MYDPTLSWAPASVSSPRQRRWVALIAAAVVSVVATALLMGTTRSSAATLNAAVPLSAVQSATQAVPMANFNRRSGLPQQYATETASDFGEPLPSGPAAYQIDAAMTYAPAGDSTAMTTSAAVVFCLLGITGLLYSFKAARSGPIAMAASAGKKKLPLETMRGNRRGAPEPEPEDDDGLLLGIAGSIFNVVFWVSLYSVYSTGQGVPAGPFGLYGLAEGLSYLAVPGLFAYSVYTKVQTGSGLPAGKFGLLGLAEGLTFLSLLAGVVVAGLKFVQ